MSLTRRWSWLWMRKYVRNYFLCRFFASIASDNYARGITTRNDTKDVHGPFPIGNRIFVLTSKTEKTLFWSCFFIANSSGHYFFITGYCEIYQPYANKNGRKYFPLMFNRISELYLNTNCTWICHEIKTRQII